MTMNKSYKYILLPILALGAVSCNKSEIDGGKSNDITFEVKNGGMSLELTKGQRYNSETEFEAQTFGVYGWNNTKSDEVVYNNVSVSLTDGKWTPASSKSWSPGSIYTFEAVYPKPEASLGSIGLTALTTDVNPANLSFSYKVPTTTMADEDKDFMLACYRGTGTKGEAPLYFTHPLTCVNFIAGDLRGISKINSITLKGVYESGTCTVRLTTGGDDELQCYSYEQNDASHTSLWTPTGSTTVTGTSQITASSISTTTWAYNFLLIPQNTATQNVTLTLNITTADNETFNISTKINSDYWRAGYTNTYKVNYGLYDLVLDPVHVTPWDTVGGTAYLTEVYNLSAKAVSNSVNPNGGNFQISVTSYSTLDGGTTKTAEPWTVEYSATGEEGSWSSVRPSMISSDLSGTGSTSSEVKNVVVGAQSGTSTGTIDFAEVHKAALKAAPVKADYDLSLYNPATGEYRTAQNTANCYIVNAPGSYKFPLVYGNAIKNGAVNSIAFAPGKTTTTGISQPLLPYFVNCKDKAITSPYIKTDIDALTGDDAISGDYTAELIWQDVNGLIMSSGLGVSGNYITFQVSGDNISQGNAIIALKKGSTIVWSWHIWVTDEDMSKDNTYVVTSTSKQYQFMNVNLGQVDKGSVSGATQYEGREYYLRLVQTASGKRSLPIKISQVEGITGGTRTNSSTSTTYQWGRKDPLFCANTTNTAFDINGNSITAYTGVDSRSTSFSKTIGNLIMNPASSFFAGTIPKSSIETNYYNLWNNGEINGQNHIYDIPVVKTIYDPSPVGFYVPSIMAFKGISSDGSGFNRGWSFSMSDGNSLYLPTNGCRVAWQTQYAWTYDGTRGYYLSCTADAKYNSGKGYVLTLMTTNSVAADDDARVERYYACSVRPVKE